MKTLSLEPNPENPNLQLLLLDDGRYEFTGFKDDPLIIQIGPKGISEQGLLAILSHRRGGAVTIITSDEKVSGVEMIYWARQHQLSLGRDAKHDRAYDLAELNAAATCYAGAAHIQALAMAADEDAPALEAPPLWPWATEAWKPRLTPEENLAVAGALIAAEIDRLKHRAQYIADIEVARKIAIEGGQEATTQPVEQPPVEQPPVEQPPVEQPPVEQPPGEQPPGEQPPGEQPPVEPQEQTQEQQPEQ